MPGQTLKSGQVIATLYDKDVRTRLAPAGGKASKLDTIKQHRELIALELQRLELRLLAAVATIQLENIYQRVRVYKNRQGGCTVSLERDKLKPVGL